MDEKRGVIGIINRPRRTSREKLGEYLVRNNLITREELNRGLRIKQSSNIMIGAALIRLGLIDEDDIAHALSDIWELELIDNSELESSKDVICKIPEHIVRHNMLLPLCFRDGRLFVAVDKPLNKGIIRSVERIVHTPLVQKIAPSGTLHNAIALAYTEDTVIDGEGVSATELVDDIIVKAVKFKASDIHLEPLEERVRLRYRIDGVLKEVESYNLDQYGSVVARVKVMSGLDIAEKRMPQDGAISFEKGGIITDLRVSSLPSLYGEKVVMRLLAGKSTRITIDQIGLSSDIYETFLSMLKRPYGIVMIVGPTGSGKSTTLSAALNTINNPDINIVTVEDPVEYKIEGITQVQVGQRNKLSFAGALRAILRQDPDVIMVGETRDSETADISLRAALTGHIVFTTLHTNDAPGALPRLVDMGCEPFLVSSSVNGVLAQRLVRKLCPHCRMQYSPPEDERRFIGAPLTKPPIQWYKAVGCPRCNKTGYSGRTGIFELLEVNQEIQRAVMKGESGERLMEIARSNGMKTLRQNAILKLNNGITSFDEVVRVTIG